MSTKIFRDSRGTVWTVFEVPPSHISLDGRVIDESEAHLTFECASGSRSTRKRLSGYPDDWESLGDDQLQELLHRATTYGGGAAAEESEIARRRMDELST